MNKKLVVIVAALIMAAIALPYPALAQQNDSNAAAVEKKPAATTEEKAKSVAEGRTKKMLDGLGVTDAAKEAKAREVMVAYFEKVELFQAKNKADIKELWTQWSATRNERDANEKDPAKIKMVQGKITAAADKVTSAYAELKPAHMALLADLGKVLTAEQIDAIKDKLTVNKVKVTFNAYCQIFPGLTDPQKAHIMESLKAAREEAMDAGTMDEKSAFFKMYKDKVEAYLTDQGYNVRQSYKDFSAKQKAEKAAKEAAASKPASAPAKPAPTGGG